MASTERERVQALVEDLVGRSVARVQVGADAFGFDLTTTLQHGQGPSGADVSYRTSFRAECAWEFAEVGGVSFTSAEMAEEPEDEEDDPAARQAFDDMSERMLHIMGLFKDASMAVRDVEVRADWSIVLGLQNGTRVTAWPSKPHRRRSDWDPACGIWSVKSPAGTTIVVGVEGPVDPSASS